MTKLLEKIICKYKEKACALIFKIEDITLDGNQIEMYTGTLNNGHALFFITIKTDETFSNDILQKLNNYIETVGQFDYMGGRSFILFFNEKKDEWFRLSIKNLKHCWQCENEQLKEYIEPVKKTVYGPDFLNKIFMPFKLVKNHEDDLLAVFGL